MKKLLLTTVFALLFTLSTLGQAGTSCWRKVSAGNNFTLAIKSDGTLWGWGLNGNRLGLGYFSATELQPIQVGTANDWSDVSAGENHALALKNTGTLWAWGDGQFGQLGNGAFNSATFTITQVGTANDWVAISAGTKFSLAIKNTGTLWSWGLNSTGQLGQNNNTNLNLPTQVGTANDWFKIEAGHQHALAIKTNNTLWSWGDNTTGQLGDGTNTTSLVPIIISTLNIWQEISAGFDHSMALDITQNLYTWGNNNNGQLGDGTNTATNLPAIVNFTSDGTPSLCIAISAGQTHSLIIRNNNTLWSSGFNNQGQLGLGNNTNTNFFNQVGTNTNWFLISAGFVHSHALEFGANLWSAGRGLEGQLGVNSNTNSNVLVMVNCPLTLSNNQITANNLNFSLYPNPTNDIVNIYYNIDNSSKITISVTNIQGQIINEIKVNRNSGIQTETIDLSNQSSGMYFITLTTETSSFTEKVVKR